MWAKFKADSSEVDGPLAIAIARRILDCGPLTDDEYFAACGDCQTGHKFLLRHIFAIDGDGLYTFENKMMENAVRARDQLASNCSSPQ